MRSSGKIAQPRCLRVRAIELGAFPYPTPDQGHGRLREWVIFLWHAVIDVIGADQLKEFAARRLAGNYRRRFTFAASHEGFEGVRLITTLHFFRAVTPDALLREDGSDLPDKTDAVGGITALRRGRLNWD